MKDLAILSFCYFCGICLVQINNNAMNVATKDLLAASNMTSTLASLPYGLHFGSTAASIAPLGYFSSKFGYKPTLVSAILIGVVGNTICTVALFVSEGLLAVSLLSLGAILQGVSFASVQYYRHIAALLTTSNSRYAGRNVAVVITSGALASIIGSLIPPLTRSLSSPYAATYVAATVIALLQLVAMSLASQLDSRTEKVPDTTERTQVAETRPLLKIVAQPRYLFAMINATITNGMMFLAMAISSLALSALHTSFWYISAVMQTHGVLMFIPSFLTSRLVCRFGTETIVTVGAFLTLVGVAFYAVNIPEHLFPLALCGLAIMGLGWNFSHVGSTTMLATTFHGREKFKAQGLNDSVIMVVACLLAVTSASSMSLIGLQGIAISCIVLCSVLCIANLGFIVTGYAKQLKN